MKKVTPVVFVIACFVVISLAYAQPKIPKEKIRENIFGRGEIERLYSSDPVERGTGAYFLGESKSAAIAAVPFLIDMLDDSTPLYYGGSKPANSHEKEIMTTSPGREAAKALIKIGDSSIIEQLIAIIKSGNSHARGNAVWCLGVLGAKDSRTVDLLVAALKDEDKYVRWHAALGLQRIKNKRIIEPLVNAFRDEDEYVRRNAARALAVQGESAIEPLITALQDKETEVRNKAAWALYLINIPDDEMRKLDKKYWERALDLLIPALKDDNDDLRLSVALALKKIKSPNAVKPLIECLKDPYRYDVMGTIIYPVRDTAQEALTAITGQSFGSDQAKWQEWWEKNKESFKE